MKNSLDSSLPYILGLKIEEMAKITIDKSLPLAKRINMFVKDFFFENVKEVEGMTTMEMLMIIDNSAFLLAFQKMLLGIDQDKELDHVSEECGLPKNFCDGLNRYIAVGKKIQSMTPEEICNTLDEYGLIRCGHAQMRFVYC